METRDALTPAKFNAALAHCDFDFIGFDKTMSPLNRKKLMLGVMAEAMSLLLVDLPLDRRTSSTVLLVGQHHNDRHDRNMSLELAAKIRDGVVVLERAGTLHPNLPGGYAELASQVHESNLLVTENALHNMHDAHTTPLSYVERSWLVGMYIACLLLENPQRPITAMFGEDHLNDMAVAVNVFLQHAGCPDKPLLEIIPSHVNSMQEAKLFTVEELAQSQAEWRAILKDHCAAALAVAVQPVVGSGADQADVEQARVLLVKSVMEGILKVSLTHDSTLHMALTLYVTSYLDRGGDIHVLNNRMRTIKEAAGILGVRDLNNSVFQSLNRVFESGGAEHLLQRVAFAREIMDLVHSKNMNIKFFEMFNAFLDNGGGSAQRVTDIAKSVAASSDEPGDMMKALIKGITPPPVMAAPAALAGAPARTVESAASANVSLRESDGATAVSGTPRPGNFAMLVKGLTPTELEMLTGLIQVMVDANGIQEAALKQTMITLPSSGDAVGDVGKVMALVDEATAVLAENAEHALDK